MCCERKARQPRVRVAYILVVFSSWNINHHILHEAHTLAEFQNGIDERENGENPIAIGNTTIFGFQVRYWTQNHSLFVHSRSQWQKCTERLRVGSKRESWDREDEKKWPKICWAPIDLYYYSVWASKAHQNRSSVLCETHTYNDACSVVTATRRMWLNLKLTLFEIIYHTLYFHFAFCKPTQNYTRAALTLAAWESCAHKFPDVPAATRSLARPVAVCHGRMVSGWRNDYISNWKINWLRLVLMMAELVCDGVWVCEWRKNRDLSFFHTFSFFKHT